MPFDVSVENGSNVSVDRISLTLKQVRLPWYFASLYSRRLLLRSILQVATFHCHVPRPNTKTSHVDIVKVETARVRAHSTDNWTEKLEIPSLLPYNLINCSIIDLNYEIKASLIFKIMRLISFPNASDRRLSFFRLSSSVRAVISTWTPPSP